MSLIDLFIDQFQKYLFVGTGGRFCYAIMDELYSADMTVKQALEAVKQCMKTFSQRLVSYPRAFSCTVIDKNGITYMPSLFLTQTTSGDYGVEERPEVVEDGMDVN